MSDEARTPRLRGEPNQAEYKKAKKKYKISNADWRTEYTRLCALNSSKPFTPEKNAVEHALLYRLIEVRLQGDIGRYFIMDDIFVILILVLQRSNKKPPKLYQFESRVRALKKVRRLPSYSYL